MKFPRFTYSKTDMDEYKMSPEFEARYADTLRKISDRVSEYKENAVKDLLINLGWTPPAEEKPERSLMIGGHSDGSTISFPIDCRVIKSPVPGDFCSFNQDFACKAQTYNRLTIGGVDVWAVEGMTESDVMHTLISRYRKDA